jgi:hypothetical protein
MTIHRSLALVLALIAGILSASVARAVSRNTSGPRPIASALSAPSADTAPAVTACNAERAELASIKSQLAVCMAISMRAPKAVPPDVPEASTTDPSESPEIRRNRELLENDSEAVIVRRADGTIGVYKPEEWPSDSDGLIIGRKFPDGTFGWYGRQTTHGRRAMFGGIGIKLKPDGTITWLGKPAPPKILRMLGLNVDEPDAGQGAAEPPAASTLATPP